jgi:hypothetical protein
VAVGIPVNKAEIDNVAGSAARSLFNVFSNIQQIKAFLDTKTTGDLEAMGYTANEAAVLKSAYADLAELAATFNGSAPGHTTAHDFRTFAKQLIGIIY